MAVNQVAIDQPRYSGFRAALGEDRRASPKANVGLRCAKPTYENHAPRI
jgi:hypothetical protein